MLSTVARRRLIDTWRTEEPNEHGFVEDSCVRDQTQDGDVHKNLGPSDRPMHNERRKGVNKNQSSQSSTHRWRHKRQTPWPNPTARQARVSRVTPENRENNVKRSNKQDDVRQPSRNGSRHRGPKTQRPPGTRYDGAETSRRHRNVPGHRCASGASGQKPAESHQLPHKQPTPPPRQLQPPPPPRPLGRLPHGTLNVRRCRAAEKSAASK